MLHAMHACMYNNISSVLAGQDDLDRALTKYHKALEIQEHEALTSLTVTTCYNNIGSVLLDLGSIERVSQGPSNSRAQCPYLVDGDRVLQQHQCTAR